MRAATIAVIFWVGFNFACSGGYGRGNCPAGYFEIDGKCKVAVGPPCESSSQCLSNFCLVLEEGKGFCTIHCKSHEDCPAAFFCEQKSGGRCVPGEPPDACQSDEDCPSCQFCQEGLCAKKTGCQPCEKDYDCGPCRRCERGECRDVAGCVVCSNDGDCPVCQVCQQGACGEVYSCVRCSSDEQCPGCFFCSRGMCQEIAGCGTSPCFNDSDCPSRTRCLENRLLGIRTCLPVNLEDGQDCAAGGDAVCASGLCLFGENNRFFCTKPCSADSDCSWPLVCDFGLDCSRGCCEPYFPAPESGCTRSLDCRRDSLCVPQAGSGRWVYRCLAMQKCGEAEGAACQSFRFCRSRFCGPDNLCTLACRGQLDCPRGQRCQNGEFPLPSGGLYPLVICRPGAEGEVGEPCQSDEDCREGKCLKIENLGRCTKPCSSSSDCPDNFSCRLVENENFCWPQVFSGKCASDRDCPLEASCFLVDSPLRLDCAFREEFLPAGELCHGNSQCRSGLCLPEGVCSALCTSEQDCPNGMICTLEEVSLDGHRGFLRLCRLAASEKICWSNLDCPTGEVCRLRYFPLGPGPDGRCRPQGHGARLGEKCTGPVDCADGECTLGGRCASLCVDDSDCPQGFECRPEKVAWADLVLKLCLDIARQLGQACPGGDGDCAEGLFCHQFSELGPLCTRQCSNWYDCDPAGTFDCQDAGERMLLCQPR